MKKRDKMGRSLPETTYAKGCIVDGCLGNDRRPRRGWCTRHYMRFIRNGDPLGGGTEVGIPKKYFEEKLLLQTDDCIEWPFARVTDDYGVLSGDRRVHREALKRTVGEPPEDKPIAIHSCDNPPCFNPRHLRWGSFRDNNTDMVKRNREYRGSRQHLSKLTEKEVLEIRASDKRQVALSKIYGVSQAQISSIMRGVQWRWLK